MAENPKYLFAKLVAEHEQAVDPETLEIRRLADEFAATRQLLMDRAKKDGEGGGGGGWFERAWVRWVVGLMVVPWVVTVTAFVIRHGVEPHDTRQLRVDVEALEKAVAQIQESRFTGAQGATLRGEIEALRQRMDRNERYIDANREALARHLARTNGGADPPD